MLLIHSQNPDVYFNLAAEEYLLHQFSEDVLLFWKSRKAVVCGKHQNVCGEVNYGFCKETNTDIARRLSGGGTVFHDPGNINFTFIQNLTHGLEFAVDYRRFLEPVRAALQHIGYQTTYSVRNDLLYNGKKISGNAEHVLQKQKRVLHHGTLLYSANLHSLESTLQPCGSYFSKAVPSVKSPVTNLSPKVHSDSEAQNFMGQLIEYFSNQKHTNRYVFNESDHIQIEKLRAEKYAADSWILGYSPEYTCEKPIQTENGILQLKYRVKKQVVFDFELYDNSLTPALTNNLDTLNNQLLSPALFHDLGRLIGLEESFIAKNPYFLF